MMRIKQDEKTKKTGQVFTPRYIVEEILDYAGYRGDTILQKHIIDNSCGDGAFLTVAVALYCTAANNAGITSSELKFQLETFFHGIDREKAAFEDCKKNLDKVAKEFGIENVKWDLYNQSALSMKKFDGKMDFVVGNPPYVRVHNLESSYDDVKQFRFANGGMTDLYLAFFELGFNMLNASGKLCYITPSSWLNSVAAENMRKYIMDKQNLVSLTDFGHFQVFENVITYTMISLFAKGKKNKSFDYYKFDGKLRGRIFVDSISLCECFIDSHFYLADKKHLAILKDIKTKKTNKFVSVKNGFATLADKVFIGDNVPDSSITIRTLKASTGKWYKCLFPYDKNGKLLSVEYVFSDTEVAEYFNTHKEYLLKGKPYFPTFYQYGRTQALSDVWRNKIAINTLLRTEKDLKISEVKTGEGVYSGLYIISDVKIPFEDIKEILVSKDFAEYIHLLKKYKSGGYYTFNSGDIQKYINYCLTKSNKEYADELPIFGKSVEVLLSYLSHQEPREALPS